MTNNSTPSTPAPEAPDTPSSGKGRPTPPRREREAANKRPLVPNDRKEAARQNRAKMASAREKARIGLANGEERYLPARDKGPVRRLVRDYVDSRLCMAELLLPLLIIIMVTSAVNAALSNGLWTATIVLVGLDTALLVFRLRRELARRFPDVPTKGSVGYGVLRSLQLRFIRLPKTTTKLGAKLPDRY